MSNHVNKIILLGRLTADSELRYTPQSAPVLNFSIATNKSWKDKSGELQSRAVFHRCLLWGKRGEALNQFMKKGNTVYVEGEVDKRKFTDKSGAEREVFEVIVSDVQLIGSSGRGEGKEGEDEGPEL